MQTEKKGSRKKMKNSNRSRIIALACCVVLLVSALIGGGMAKYVTQKQSSGEGETFNARLFDEETKEFRLVEYNKTTNKDGSSGMGADEVLSNDYYMIPGTAILKLPMVSWKNKTSIPAYLYLLVEGDDSKLNEFEYGIDSNIWLKIDGEEGTTGLYAFCDGGTVPKKLDETDPVKAGIQVIAPENDLWYVFITKLQELEAPKTLSFTAYAIQAPGDTATVADAKAVWDANKDGSDKILIDTTAKVVNTFTPGSVTASIVENGEPVEGETSVSAKNSITVKNTGNVPALVRAKLVVNWIKLGEDSKPVRDEDGTPVIIANPVGTDGNPLTITPSYSSDWTTNLGDGYCYYNDYVAAGAATTDLLAAAITAPTNTPAGYAMQVEVITEAMQATGYNYPRNPVDGTGTDANSAMYLAWNHFFNGSTWQ